MHINRESSILKDKQLTYHWSDEVLLLAVEQILEKVTVSRDYDIPYLAGYNYDARIVYIDRHLPKTTEISGKQCNVDKYLILHEVVENALEDFLKLEYHLAHQIALRIERQAVEADGFSWKEYDAFMQKWIKTAEHEKITKTPKDLDLKPYQDEKDTALLKKIKSVMEQDNSLGKIFEKIVENKETI